MRYALINRETLKVEQLCEFGPTPLTSFGDYMVVESDTANIGDTYDVATGTFRAPDPPPSE